MDAKNQEALTYGPEWMLAKFANLGHATASDDFEGEVAAFRNRYGELYPGLGTEGYWFCAEFVFRAAWHARTLSQKEQVSADITRLLERQEKDDLEIPVWETEDPRWRPALVADFAAGKVELRPRTLLDWLVKSLLEHRDELAICGRNGCPHPYFVKGHPRQRFCSSDCANSARVQKKQAWWAKNRERFIRKWRLERKAARKPGGRKRGRRAKR